MLKSIEEYCKHYFDNYNAKYHHRDAWLKIREIRYKQIRDNHFYLDTDSKAFKKEVLQFWEGNKYYGGYSYGESYTKTDKDEWILFQNRIGETLAAEETLNKVNSLVLHGNYSWSMLFMGGDIAKDISKLRKTVKYLLDEKINIAERVNNVLRPDGKHKIDGMSNGKSTVFLHMAYPGKYGVWNGPVDGAFKILSKVDERFKIKESDLGEKYEKINKLLNYLKSEYSFKKYKNGFKNLSDVDIFVWYVADKFSESKDSKKTRNFQLDTSNLSDDVLSKISGGENSKIEFKESIANPFSIAKAISSFMNSNGGTLLIGVQDDGNISGLPNNFDTANIENIISGYFLNRIRTANLLNDNIIKINSHNICKIEIKPSNKPIYIKSNNQTYFFIRKFAASPKLEVHEVCDYISEHDNFVNNIR